MPFAVDLHHASECTDEKLVTQRVQPNAQRDLLARNIAPVHPQIHAFAECFADQVFFYEQDFYVLSNFSAFTLQWKGLRFDTSEAAYHWEKFPDAPEVQDMLLEAPSAHAAFKIAESQKVFRRPDWDEVKLDVMREILRAKADQHEYVRRKLLATGDRELVEDSWRDSYWGWGPNRDGQNMLGKLWMEVRAELVPHNARNKPNAEGVSA